MTKSRREVRATQAFFEELDQQLGDERGPKGEPSTSTNTNESTPSLESQAA